MKKRPLNVYIFTFFSLISAHVFAQGCSDAGFCTMGAMKPDQPFNKKIEFKLRTMELSFYRGTTTLTPIVYVATADMSFDLSSKTSFQVKLPYQAITGRLANTSGVGDISLCFTRNILSAEKYNVRLSVGGKIPTNQSDKKNENGLPLPMYYQTSLGTYDVITGLCLITNKWLFATGIQVPLNKNNNQFVWSAWDGKVSEQEKLYVDKYNQAKDLQRGIDVMLRVERNFRFSRLNFSLGLLPIYRITRDEFTKSGKPANSLETRIIHDDAQGLALSGIFTTGYNFNVRSGIKLLLGDKFINRKVNPDGLTREFVSTFSYFYRFGQ